MDQTLEIADAHLVVATVVIGATRHPQFPGALDKSLHRRMVPFIVGDRQIARAPVDTFVTDADAHLAALEVGQNIDITPAAIATLRPMVEILTLPTVINHPVDGA